MPVTRALIVLDCQDRLPNAALQAAWNRSDFAARLKRLGFPICIWRAETWNFPAQMSWPRIANRAALDEHLETHDAQAIVVIDPDQIFFDPELALAGLAAFDPEHLDSFTQWEHCRLPVGVGLRALATRTWRASTAAAPRDAFDELRHAPAGHTFGYDVVNRVPFEESLLDARFGPILLDFLRGRNVSTWGLGGFLDLVRNEASNTERAALRYRPSRKADRVDERRMPAAYGFESEACAEFPTYVMFDITNVCNARCIHCPQSLRDDDGSKPEFLLDSEHQTLAAFQHVIDECAQHTVNFVRITADGEPLVHPDIFEMLDYARDRGVGPVGLTTNGSLLTEKRAQRLLDARVAMVDFSLDAARPETFEAIRVGLNFEKTKRNILRFLEMRDAAGSDTRVIVSFVKQESNSEELDEFLALWSPRVDEVVVREMISNVGLNTPSENLWPGWDARWPCAHFFRRVVINHRGILKACPIDWEQKTVNKSVHEASLFDQWHGDFYWTHRMQHLNDAISDQSACKECPDWAGTPWNLGYEKIVQRVVSAGSAA